MSAPELIIAKTRASTEELRTNAASRSLAGEVTHSSSWLSRWLPRLTTFVIGQGLVQGLSLITGFLLIHWLSVEQYAAYSLVTGFQSAVGVLMELGLGGSIVALVGGRTDPHIVGRYIRSVRHYRDLFFLILLPVVVIAFSALTLRQGWTWSLTAVLLTAILVAIYGQTIATYYSTPLIIHQELGRYYHTPSVLGTIRLLACFVLHALSSLTSASAVWIGSVVTVAVGWFYKRQSAKHLIQPATADPATNREVLAYVRPLLPSTIYFALQGQITILLISWFGQARSIAEVGALGRIAQLFLLLSAFNVVVVAPNIARLARPLLARRYLQVIGGALGLSAAMVGLSALVPDVLLWILGRNYSHLKNELVLMMGIACLNYLSGVIWTMHSARKWIPTWIVWAYIGTSLAVQVFGIAFWDLSTTRNVLQLSLFTAFATIIVQIVWAIHGFFVHEPYHHTQQ